MPWTISRGEVFHHHGVLVQERLAFGAVGDDGVGLGGELDVSGKTAAAGADDAGFFDFFRKGRHVGEW